MRLLHSRVRTLMAVVGAVAMILWGAMMSARSYDYNRRARQYSLEELGWKEAAARGRFDARVTSECAEYCAELARKYRRAMWRPWMAVAPDPRAPGHDRWVEQERRANEVAPDAAGHGAHPPRNP